MVFKGYIPADIRASVFQLRQNTDMSIRQIAKVCGISPASATRVLKVGIQRRLHCCRRSGRPKKLSARQERILMRNLLKLRNENPGFSVKDLMTECGVSLREVSERTVSRLLQRNGYFYLQTRKKGLLTKSDLCERVRFAKLINTVYGPDVWTKQIAFYLDGVSFAFKTNPLEAARAPKARIWRKLGEGLSFGCTAKGRKEGTGGKLVKLFVGITYNEGVVLCEPYEHLSGASFAAFIEKHFNPTFTKANKNGSRLWVQDNDPSQSSRLAKNAMKNCNCDTSLIALPCRSPDLFPPENFFHLVRCKLKKDALRLNITKETYQEFKERVIRTIYSIPVENINKIIASMPDRLDAIIDKNGCRTKY